MTYEEFKEKFPVGSRFDLGEGCNLLGTLTKYDDENKWGWVTLDDYDGEVICACKVPDSYLIQHMKPIFNCPRCRKEMSKKQTDQYGLIDKCSNCGYC